MKIAYRVKEHSFKAGQKAYVYRLDPPLVYSKSELSETGEYGWLPTVTEHVWVSGNHVPFTGPETYMFPCDSEGTVTDWGELGASQRGFIDPDRVVRETGYEVKEEE